MPSSKKDGQKSNLFCLFAYFLNTIVLKENPPGTAVRWASNNWFVVYLLIRKQINYRAVAKYLIAACGGREMRSVRGHLALRQGAAAPWTPAFCRSCNSPEINYG
jgi:hypothetical protein